MDWLETAPKRAVGDAIAAQRTLRFKVWEAVLAVAGAAWLTAIAPDNASSAEQVGRAVGGGLIGLITAVLVALLFNFIRAPYRQRNEARDTIIGQPRLALDVEGHINWSRPMRLEVGDDPIDVGNMLWAAGNVLVVNKSATNVVLKPQLRLLSSELSKPIVIDLALRCKVEDKYRFSPELPHCENPLVLSPGSGTRVHLDFMLDSAVLDLIGFGIVARAQNRLQFFDVLSGECWVAES